MFKAIAAFILLMASVVSSAQQTDVATVEKQAQLLAQQQDFTGAIQLLDQALQQHPDDLNLLKDESYISYLGRDYQRAMQVGKGVVVREDADVQSFQILGLTYKAIADYKDADKMYKTALKKFPSSGVLYSEYGDMLMLNSNPHEAIAQWEKGIQADAASSGNYYYAAKYYAGNNNILWSCMYGEIFINIESLTRRTDDIKNILLSDYKNILNDNAGINNLKTNGNAFEKAVAGAMSAAMQPTNGKEVSPEMITAFRSRFILNWNNSYAIAYPYHLFDFETKLLRDGLFDAYNQWLFGNTINKNRYDNWAYTHSSEAQEFAQYQRNVLFKMPQEQYYSHQ